MHDSKHVTTITVTGHAEAVFESVTYSLTIKTTGDNGSQAREKAQSLIKMVTEALQKNAATAAIDMERLETTCSVTSYTTFDRESNNHVFAGYMSTFTLRCKGTNISMATDLHDQLTAIKGVVADTLVFNIKDTSELERIAFESAYTEAMKRFTNQCAIIGETPSNYTVNQWSIDTENRHYGKTMSLDDNPNGNLKPGKATFAIRATFSFSRN